MNARQLIESEFLAGFFTESRRYIGVELEFPLLSLEGDSVSDEVIHGLPDYLLKQGFSTEERDVHGNSAFLVNTDGDCLSFDNSYNNFEFAMAKDENLSLTAARFYKLYSLVQAFLLPRGHTLCGMGTNPHHHRAETRPVDYPIYQTLQQFLSGFSGGYFHPYTDFPAWLSSVQTHLDVDAGRLPRALTLFAAMDFVRGLLFANSLPFADADGFEATLCFRDYLWEHSGFGSLADNVGPVCGSFETLDDIVDMFCRKSMFLTCRSGQYSIMPPQRLDTYFDTQGSSKDAGGYLSFKNVEITRRGTLEIRSDCAQPVGAAFAPPAFHLGILHGLAEAEALMNDFFRRLPASLAEAPDRNALLRRMAIHGEAMPVREEDLRALLLRLVALAESKLRGRGLGEERLLLPLCNRAEALLCPARVIRSRLMQGEDMSRIIADLASPEYVI